MLFSAKLCLVSLLQFSSPRAKTSCLLTKKTDKHHLRVLTLEFFLLCEIGLALKLNSRHLQTVLGVKAGSLWFEWSYLPASAMSPFHCAGQLCSSPRANAECHVGSTEFVFTQCGLELEKELHSNFLLALRKAKASLQQNCKARMLPGAFVIIGRQLVSRPYSQLTCAGSPFLNCRDVLYTQTSSHEESIFLASSWRTPNTLLFLLFGVVGVPAAWEQV